MKRRDFLRHSVSTLGAASFALTTGHARRARAQSGDKLWVFIDANGAWDPTFHCDPHPNDPNYSPFTTADLLSVGSFTYAPRPDGSPYLVGGQDFFQKFFPKMTVFRGVDMETNSHDVGPRVAASGRAQNGYPHLGSLLSRIASPDEEQVLAFLSTGGYDTNAGMTATTRLGRSVDPLLALAQPNRISPATNNTAGFHHSETLALIAQRQAQRHARLMNDDLLPAVRDRMGRLQSLRETEFAFAPVVEALSDIPELTPYEDNNPLIPNARIGLAAMNAGVCTSINLSMRGFDTHDGHNVKHVSALQQVFDAINYVYDTAVSQGLDDRLVIFVNSDFGRTTYNADAGKDHWPITSFFLLGPDIEGGRVVNETYVELGKDGVTAPNVISTGDDVVPTATFNEGVRLAGRYVHQALREYSGQATHPLMDRFPILHAGEVPLAGLIR